MYTSTKVSYLCPYCSASSITFEIIEKLMSLLSMRPNRSHCPDGIIRITINGQDYQLNVEPDGRSII